MCRILSPSSTNKESHDYLHVIRDKPQQVRVQKHFESCAMIFLMCVRCPESTVILDSCPAVPTVQSFVGLGVILLEVIHDLDLRAFLEFA